MRAVDLLTDSLLGVLESLSSTFFRFFRSYIEREYHYSGVRLAKVFDDWLAFSARRREYEKALQKDDEDRIETIQALFCRETAYALIGRLLFARISEDKGVIPYRISGQALAQYLRAVGHLQEDAYIKAVDTVYREMEGFYERAYLLNAFFDWWKLDPGYKGTLHSDDSAEQEDLERDLNHQLMRILQRLNRFDFEEVDRDLLKDVYQHYLPPEERKSLGEFYTPDPVILYILDVVGYTPDQPIEKRTVLDPACGSGGFIVECVRRLIQRYVSKGLDPSSPEVAEQVLDTIRKNIFGLDIHPFAVFIAEMNVLFQVVDLYAAVRRKKPDYSIGEFRIHRTDSLREAAPPMEIEAFVATNSIAKQAVEEVRQAQQVKKLEFDLVVGNPPYVRVDNLPETDRKDYKKLYPDLLKGKWDIYIPFVKRGLDWVGPEGRFCYIVSNKFFLAESGIHLRELILKNYTIERIVDLSGVDVFEESLPSPAIVLIEKQEPAKDHHILTDVKTSQDVSPEVRKRVEGLDRISALEIVISALLSGVREIPLTQFDLLEDEESLITVTLPDSLRPLVTAIEKNSLLFRDICTWPRDGEGRLRIEEGDTTREEEGNVKKPSEYAKLSQKSQSEYRKVVRGGNIKHFAVAWDGDMIRESRDPQVRARILIKDIAKRPKAAVDTGEYRCLRTVYCAYPNPSIVGDVDVEDLGHFLTGLLNSELIHFYYLAMFYTSRMSPREGNFRFYTHYLKRLPIRFGKEDHFTQIRDLSGGLVQMADEYWSLRAAVDSFPQSYGPQETSKLMDVATSVSGLKRERYRPGTSLKVEAFADLQGRKTYKVVIGRKDFFTFPDRHIAEYAARLIGQRGTWTRKDLLALELPEQEEATRILRKHGEDSQRLLELPELADEMIGRLDKAVYGLYGVDKKSVAAMREVINHLGYPEDILS